MNPKSLLDRATTLVELGKDDHARLVELGKMLTPHADAMAEAFYAALDKDAAAKAILDSDAGRRKKLQSTLVDWFAQVFSGKYDAAYAQGRWIIGLQHVKLGIPPVLVVSSINNVYRFSAAKIGESADSLGGDIGDYLASLTKMLAIDLAFIEQSYADSTLSAMSSELGADEALFKRFMERGAAELLAAAKG